MKTLLFLLVVGFISCSKSSTSKQNSIPEYTGLYNSTSGDSASVIMVGNGLVKIRFAYKNTNALRCTFDSLHMNTDQTTFTCNEYTTRENGPQFHPEPAVGAGVFGDNTLSFSIALSGGNPFTFNGIKKQ